MPAGFRQPFGSIRFGGELLAARRALEAVLLPGRPPKNLELTR
jgi:hypothetical protein